MLENQGKVMEISDNFYRINQKKWLIEREFTILYLKVKIYNETIGALGQNIKGNWKCLENFEDFQKKTHLPTFYRFLVTYIPLRR